MTTYSCQSIHVEKNMNNTRHTPSLPLQINPVHYIPAYEKNRYVDRQIPSSQFFQLKYPAGLLCPCSGKIYKSRTSMTAHCKTHVHHIWLEELARESPLAELYELRETVRSQKIIITTLANQIAQQMNT